MRVIAGKFKGTKLVSPRGEVRPTTDIVKGSLFSMLDAKGALRGATCLDLFCGSGALGIEALSRGAESCVFADLNTSNVLVNLDKLKLTCRVIKADFKKTLRMLRDVKFDLVFCDPPYKSGFAEQALTLIIKYGMLGDSGIAVMEHASDNDMTIPSNARVIDSRVFGVSAFEFVRGESESDISRDV
ncbi:MAG: 16S rRNA (guanine(966)-N(2))-methyltransferase RsmD [Clostridiales bacterium]|nr:16S rRNA (guanine(966)-N(2))-methyltransferase RsmD [Clostridiales bacterium]